MTGPKITTTTLASAIRDLSRCEMCDLHYTREMQQRTTIRMLELELERRRLLMQAAGRHVGAARIDIAAAVSLEVLLGTL